MTIKIILVFLCCFILLKKLINNKLVLKKYNKFQIIITTYNPKPEFLNKCLKSLTLQTYKNFSVCILDDFSDDEYKNIYRKIIKKYCKQNKWQYIFKDENNGPQLNPE